MGDGRGRSWFHSKEVAERQSKTLYSQIPKLLLGKAVSILLCNVPMETAYFPPASPLKATHLKLEEIKIGCPFGLPPFPPTVP